jgi:tetratricopeptide (TPR) repeat protein
LGHRFPSAIRAGSDADAEYGACSQHRKAPLPFLRVASKHSAILIMQDIARFRNAFLTANPGSGRPAPTPGSACRRAMPDLRPNTVSSILIVAGQSSEYRLPGGMLRTVQTSDAVEMNDLIDRARLATQRRDWSDAFRAWDAIRQRSPDDAAAHLGAGNALREAGRLDEAEALLAAAAERFPTHEQIAIAHAWLANARLDWATAVPRWQAFRARFPANPWGCLGAANALRAVGRSDAAEAQLAAAETALASGGDRTTDERGAMRLELEIAKARGDWSAVRRTAQQALALQPAPSPRLLLALAQACWHLEDAAAADDAAQRALACDPTLMEAVLIRARVATDQGDGEKAISCYRTLARLNPENVRWSLQVVQLLNWVGRVDEAVGELDDVNRRRPNDPMVRVFMLNYGPGSALPAGPVRATRGAAKGDPAAAEEEELRDLTDRAPSDAELLRSVMVDDPRRDVVLAEARNAEVAVLVFTGSNDRVSMPLSIFDRYLAALGVSAVYLKDFRRLRFLRGVQSLGEDYDSTLAALRDIVERLRVTRLCTIGNCDGGFPAIRYGVELHADRILAFQTTTHSPQFSLAKLEQGRNFMRKRLAANVCEKMTDLKPFLQARRHGSRIELFYEEEDPRDRVHALHLAGLDGVTLRPHMGQSNHHLLRRLAQRRGFRETLAGLLAVRAARCDG